MLTELRVSNLGVIADLALVLGPGVTALTGETGAGKTLVVEAIDLLLGGRADPVLVRPGALEASVEGRFVLIPGVGGTTTDPGVGDDLVVARTIPAAGRSRSYLNGRMAPLSALGDAVGDLIDLHGQHSHQSLLSPAAQREGLDQFAGVDHRPVSAARRRVRDLSQALAALGGDARSRARELDLLRFQMTELAAAGVSRADEDDTLAEEEEALAGATAHRQAATAAIAVLAGDGPAAGSGQIGVTEGLGMVLATLAGRPPLAGVYQRLLAASVDLDDAASELRTVAEALDDDPERLGQVRARRQLLRELGRKYGDTLAEVMAYADQAGIRLAELEGYQEKSAALERERTGAIDDLARLDAEVGAVRRAAAPCLARAVEEQLLTLAMPKARFQVAISEDPAGETVTWRLGANQGEPALPLTKVASGGELARTMLAVRMVLAGACGTGLPAQREQEGEQAAADHVSGAVDEPTRTLIFDEVDAGIGGEAALSVGRALAALGRHFQVLVVTHLPQVAAFADQQIAVRKYEVSGRTVAGAELLDRTERVVELSRMLSGQPGSAAARRHAEELLAFARSTPNPETAVDIVRSSSSDDRLSD